MIKCRWKKKRRSKGTNKWNSKIQVKWLKLMKLKKTRFPAGKSAVPMIFRKYWKLQSIMFWVKKNKRISQESPMKMQNGYFRHISNRKNFFTKIRLCHVLDIPDAHICAKNQRDLWQNLQKMLKNSFSGIFSNKKFFFERQNERRTNKQTKERTDGQKDMG